MAFVPLPNASLLIQLSLLLSCFSTTLYGVPIPPAEAPHHHHHHHAHPPVKPPTKPPVHSPIKPPTKPPVHSPAKPPIHSPVKPPVHAPVKAPAKPPVHPPVKSPAKKLLAVQGFVYCKPCKYKGVQTLVKAAPLAKAVVKLVCNNTKRGMVEQTKTDKHGYFLFKPKNVTTMASRKCKVFLVSSTVANCRVPTNLHGGVAGAILIPDHKPLVTTSLYKFFNVGPFAFESSKKCYY